MEIEGKELTNLFNENPYDYDYCVSLLLKYEGSQQLGDLIKLIQSNHNIEEDLLIELLNQLDESCYPFSKMIKLCQHILEDCYYVKVAKQLCSFITKSLPAINKSTGDIIYEKILSQFCFDSTNGPYFYKEFIEFLQYQLTICNDKERKTIETQLRRLYQRFVKLYPNYWDEYSSFEQDKLELTQCETALNQNKEKQKVLLEFDEKFRELDGDVFEELDELFKNKIIDIQRVINYAERIINQKNVVLIQKYLNLIKQNSNHYVLCKVLRKIIKVIEPTFEYYIQYIRLLELTNVDYSEIENQFYLLEQKLVEEETQLRFYLEFINYHTRLYLNQIDQQQKTITHDTIRNIFRNVAQKFKNLNLYDLYFKLGKVESMLFNNKANSKTAFEKCVQLDSDSNTAWTHYFYSQLCGSIENDGHRQQLRSILKRQVEVVKEDKLKAIQDWLEFEEQFGHIEQVEKALSKMMQYIEEANQEEEQQEQEESEEQQQKQLEMEEESKGMNPNQKGQKKKTKTKQAHHDGDTQNNEQVKIYVDSDRTIFVKHIPKEFNANDVLDLLNKNSGALECRIVRDKQQMSKGFAYIDFENAEQADAAAKHLSTKVISGQQIYAAVSQPPKIYTNDELTLYVYGLPYSITESTLMGHFGQGVKDVRIVRDEKGKPKGYAYVEFEELQYLTAAQQKISEEYFIDGRRIGVKQSDSLEKIKSKQQNLVILIKNLPFKARESDIKQLFDGMELHQITISKDKDGRPRGFAFVEFEKQKDFKSALTMQGLEMKGRKLEILKSDRKITGGATMRIINNKEQIENAKSNTDFQKLFK